MTYASSDTPGAPRSPVSPMDLIAMKRAGRRIVMITAYDALFGSLVDDAGVDAVLVGDSVAPVLCGEPNSLSATVSQMIYHGRIVQRGVRTALVVVDLPFLSYQVSVRDAVKNAGKVLKRTGAGAVKLEGGRDFASAVQAIVRAGIPVMGHIGTTPQLAPTNASAARDPRDELIADATALEDAGAFGMVLSAVDPDIAAVVTKRIGVPTIGYASGPHCDGEVVVLHHMLGLSGQSAHPYAALAASVRGAVQQYADDVRTSGHN